MHVLREYLRRLWATLRRSPTDPDLELRFHLEQAEEELRAKGPASWRDGRHSRRPSLVGFALRYTPASGRVFSRPVLSPSLSAGTPALSRTVSRRLVIGVSSG